MAQELKLSPDTLRAQAKAMEAVRASYESLERTVANALRDADSAWSKNLSAGFSSIMGAQIQKMNGFAQQIELGVKAAEYAAASISNADEALANILNKKVYSLTHPLPDWVDCGNKGLPDSYFTTEAGQLGSVYTTNDSEGWVSCTYLTLHNLKKKGKGFPFKVPGHAGGGQWIENCADSYREGNVYFTSDEKGNALEQLINSEGLPLEDIVVDYNSQHTSLIDKIYVNDQGKRMVDIYEVITLKEVGRYGEKIYNVDECGPFTISYDFYLNHYKNNGGVKAVAIIR